MTPPDLAIQTVAGDVNSPGDLERWAVCVDRSLREARRRGLIGRATVTIGAVAGTVGPELPPALVGGAGADEWGLRPLAPGCGIVEGHDQLYQTAAGDFTLLTAPCAFLSPSCLSELMLAARDDQVGLAEPRHIPFESSKPYGPETGDVSWASFECCLIRNKLMTEIGGFDTAEFAIAGADIDYSWRARLAGWAVRSVPWASVFVPPADPLGVYGSPDESALHEIRLLLASKFGGTWLANSWLQSWTATGTESERRAADRIRERVTGGRLPEPVSDAIDAFMVDLLELEAWIKSERLPSPPREATATASASSARPPAPERSSRVGDRDAEPFLTVVVRTQGRRLQQLEDNLQSLLCQTCHDFEVLLVEHDLDHERRDAVRSLLALFPDTFTARVRRTTASGGGRSRPLNVSITSARGRYLAWLDDDDVALPTWVEAFRHVADEFPGTVAWTQVAWQSTDTSSCAGRPTWQAIGTPWVQAADFDVLVHLRRNETPNCGLAIPSACFRDEKLSFREDLPVMEDWEMLLRAAQLRPFRKTGWVTALYRCGSPDSSGAVHSGEEWDRADSEILGDLDRGGFVLRGEYLAQLRRDLDELESRRAGTWDLEEPPFESADATDAEPRVAHIGDRRTLIISGHLDDAVLSCGELISELPHCVVLTVLAGDQADWSELRDWDAASGFEAGTNVVAARIAEDNRALALLGAEGARLDFLDGQYRDPGITPPLEALGDDLRAAIARAGAEVVLLPLGLGSADHELVAAASAAVARSDPERLWFAYQELPYAAEGYDVGGALSLLADLAPSPAVVSAGGDPQLKAAAIDQYASQVAALGEARTATAIRGPERYWELHPSAGERDQETRSLLRRRRPPSVHTSCIVCCVPRSGSWFLADLLDQTGLVGRMQEYFRPDHLPGWYKKRLLPADAPFGRYVYATVAATSSENGVFAAKLHRYQFEWFVATLRALPHADPDADDAEVISAHLPGPRYVHLRREDTVRQAISWYRAVYSDRWFDRVSGKQRLTLHRPLPDPEEPDWGHVRFLENSLRDHERRWRSFFAESGVQPLEVVYESVAEFPAETVRRILEFIEIPVPPGLWEPAVRLRKMADETTERFVEAYLAVRDTVAPRPFDPEVQRVTVEARPLAQPSQPIEHPEGEA